MPRQRQKPQVGFVEWPLYVARLGGPFRGQSCHTPWSVGLTSGAASRGSVEGAASYTSSRGRPPGPRAWRAVNKDGVVVREM